MTFRPTIRSQADLEAAWRALMGPLGFARHSIWLMVIDADDQPFPHLTQIEDTDQPPPPEELAGLGELLDTLVSDLAPGGRVAFLVSRPGPSGISPDDRAWAVALHEAGRLADVPVDVVHRACDVDLVPLPMDEVLPRGA